MKRNPVGYWFSVVLFAAISLSGCGGGGSTGLTLFGAGSATVSGTVTGTTVFAINESGAVAATCVATGSPPAFTLPLLPGHSYRFFFVTGEGTPAQRTYLLYEGTTTTFSFLPGKWYDFGLVTMDPATGKATPGTSLVTQSGVTAAGTDGTHPDVVASKIHSGLDWKFFPTAGQVLVYDGITGGLPYENRISNGGTETLATSYGPIQSTKVVHNMYWPGGVFWHTETNWMDYVGDTLISFQRQNGQDPLETDDRVDLEFPLYEGKTKTVTASGMSFVARIDNTNMTLTLPIGTLTGVVKVSATASGGFWINTYYHKDYPGYVKFEHSDGESEVLREITADVFTQADLTGTWELYQFQTSTQTPGGGWFRLVVRFDGSGQMFVDDNTTWETTNSDPAPSNGVTGSIVTVDSAGVITATGGPEDNTFHGNMASNKHLIVGTNTLSPTDKAIKILRKRVPGATYGNADLFNKSFTFHILSGGDRPEWERGDGSIDSTGSVTLANLYDSAGGHSTNIPNVGRYSVSSLGVVTDLDDPDFKGFLTPDKKILIGTGTNPLGIAGTNYDLMILTISGQTFTQADFAGTWNLHQINCGAESEWGYGTLTANASGNSTYTPLGSSRTNPLTPWSGTFSLSPSGILTEGSSTNFQGVMSYNKDFVFFTDTGGTGDVFDLSILMK